jgi:phosphoribosylamine--glycine ligase
VVLASKGYPGHYEKGVAINGMHRVGTQVYHMGTALKDGQLVTNGGRVLMVIAAGEDLAEARRKVYDEVEKIQCDNLFYRKDIAHIAFE